MIGDRILGHVRFERDAGPLEEDDAIGTIVLGGIAVIRVIDVREILSDADRVSTCGDVFEHARGPDAFFTLAVRAVVIEVAELAYQGALADAGTADDGDAHQTSTLRSTLADVNPIAGCAWVSGETSANNGSRLRNGAPEFMNAGILQQQSRVSCVAT